MTNYDTTEAALAGLTDALSQRHRPPAGVLFTAAVATEPRVPGIVLARALFSDDEQLARAHLGYDGLRLVEEWVSGVPESLRRLAEIAAGRGSIGGIDITSAVQQQWASAREVRPPRPQTGWAEWHLDARWVSASERERPSIPRSPLIAFGHPPFRDGREAISNWFWGTTGHHPSEQQLSVVLPDTRGRLTTAEWTKPGGTSDRGSHC